MLRHLLIAALISCSSALAQPVSSTFTYQGELRASGNPVSSAVDLRFRLYDAASLGTQVGPQLSISALTPSAGRFTASLDFGSVFNGQSRWLEIDVRAVGSPSFTTLIPRQALTATPNAAYALSAGAASTASNAIQLNGQSATFYQNAASLNAGTLPDARLSGTYTSALNLSSTSNSFSGSGAGLINLSASNLSTGTVSDARLSSNIPRLNAPNLFSTDNEFGGIVTMQGLRLGAGLPANPGDVLTVDSAGIGTWRPATIPLPFEAASTIPLLSCVFSITSTGLGPAICGTNTSLAGGTVGIEGTGNSSGGIGVRGYGSTGVEGLSTSSSGTGVTGSGNIGIQGTSSSANGTGVIGSASGTNDAWGVSGETTTGQAVIGRAGISPPGGGFPPGTGIVGYSNISTGFVSGIGVYGEAAANTGLTTAGMFRNASNAGTAVSGWATSNIGQNYGGDFAAMGNIGTGVRGAAVSSSGNTYGGDFSVESTDGIAVRGKANALSGFTWGGWFSSLSPNFGTGVFGYATSPTGNTYGVYGSYLSNSVNAYAVWGNGRTGCSGTKAFRIDHPTDPENKYLLHYSIESPEVLNAYSGKVTLDGSGTATITLPAYFATINKDPRYTLTPIGAPMPALHIATEISDEALAAGEKTGPGDVAPQCSFQIAGGQPNAKVSWRVEALRNDRWVREYGAPVETEKQTGEKGHYQHPDLFNQPPDKGMNYRPAEDGAPRATAFPPD